MKATFPPSKSNGASITADIRCVIIYEDFATGVHAKHFAELLADGLGGTCDCESL